MGLKFDTLIKIMKKQSGGRMKIRIALLLVFFSSFTAVACLAEDMAFDFFRETQDDAGTEKVYGFIYIRLHENDAENAIYIRVTAPVNQIIEYKGQTTVIYYPEEKKAIIFESQQAQPKIDPMGAAFKKPDLSRIGFKLAKINKAGRGIRETWAPVDLMKSPIKEVIMESAGSGSVTLLEIKSRDGKIAARMKYGDFITIKGREVPLFMETYGAVGGAKNYQKTKLSNPDAKSKLPDEILNFKIAPDAEVQMVKLK